MSTVEAAGLPALEAGDLPPVAHALPGAPACHAGAAAVALVPLGTTNCWLRRERRAFALAPARALGGQQPLAASLSAAVLQADRIAQLGALAGGPRPSTRRRLSWSAVCVAGAEYAVLCRHMQPAGRTERAARCLEAVAALRPAAGTRTPRASGGIGCQARTRRRCTGANFLRLGRRGAGTDRGVTGYRVALAA
jgi:hypothetical protein